MRVAVWKQALRTHGCAGIITLTILLGPGWLTAGKAVEPLGVPNPERIEYPDDIPSSAAEINLGKVLFFDQRLSGNNHYSCASCHNPDLGFGDGLATGMGTLGNALGRNTPHLYNLAWNSVFFWDGRATSLEEQALGPIAAPGEMNMPLDQLIPKLRNVPFYVRAFATVYPDSGLTIENVARAIAAFERTLISMNSPFDRYQQGDRDALSPAAIRGLQLFTGKANCIVCHSGPNFTDESFHNIGIGGQDPGRAEVIKDTSLWGAFKTPGLRNTALTAPYMHDGSLPSLEAVVRFYNMGRQHSKAVSELIKPLQLSEREIFDLVAFLGALTDPLVIVKPSMPSAKTRSARKE